MSALNVQEFLRKFPKVTLPPVALLCPAKPTPKAREATFEPMLADQAAARIVDEYIDPSLRDMAYTVFYADEAKPGDITLEAQTLPFLSERRVVLVRNAERYNVESYADTILHYLQSPSESTLLLFIASAIDKRMKFYKSCEKNGLVIECPELNQRELAQWVKDYLGREGKTADQEAVQEILRRAGTQLSDVKNALEVVIGYVQHAPAIRMDDVVAACADVAEEVVWTLTDAIASSQPAVALKALRKLTDMGKYEDELVGTINWLLKTAHSLARRDPMSSFLADKIRPLVQKLGPAKIKAAFALTTDTHFLMRSTGVDASLALELLVLKLAAPTRSSGG